MSKVAFPAPTRPNAAELTANRSQVAEVIGGHKEARGHIETLVRLTDSAIQGLPQLQVSQIMVSTCNPWSFDPVVGTLEALIGSGRLGILRHAPLRESLTTFRNLVADAAFMESNAMDVWRAEVPLGGPWTDPETEVGVGEVLITSPDYVPRATAADLIRIRKDAQFMGLVSRCHINIGYYVADLERLHSQVLLVLNRIEESA